MACKLPRGNKFSTLSDEVSGGDEEISFKGSIQKTLAKAFDDSGVFSDKGLPKQRGGEADNVKSLIHEVLRSMQPVLVDVVAAAVAASTRELVESLRAELAAVTELRTGLNKAKAQIQVNRSELDRLEQYTRKDNIRIFGLPEKRDEDTSQLVIDLAKELGADVTKGDLSDLRR